MFPVISAVLLSITLAGSLARADAGSVTPRTPVLLELFTSEGCSSCPPADALLEKLDRTQPVRGADLVVLSEHVDYWDSLGWKDAFSSAQYTARQNAYAQKIDPAGGVYTPELVIDGRAGVVGSDWGGASAAIQQAAATKKRSMSISRAAREGNKIIIHVDAEAPSQTGSALYVALADDRDRSHVTRGENQGRTLSHVAVVRALTFVGTVPAQRDISRDISMHLPDGAGANGLRIVAFVQDQKTGAILSLASSRL
jgi:hypothetical protein